MDFIEDTNNKSINAINIDHINVINDKLLETNNKNISEYNNEIIKQTYKENKEDNNYENYENNNYLELQNNKFKFEKPINWNNLLMFEKIKFYSSILDNRYSCYVDKIEAKKIVNILTNGEIKQAKIIKYLDENNNFNDLLQDDINKNYILKASHGCKYNIDFSVITNLNVIKKKLEPVKQCYSYTEKQYINIKPRFFIEEKINDKLLGITGKAIVYMIRCIYNNPVSIGVLFNNISLLFDINWKQITNYKINIPKPINLNKMTENAKILSKRFEFVRIDYYIDINDDIYFSEFTFTPANGCKVFTNKIEFDNGKLWI